MIQHTKNVTDKAALAEARRRVEVGDWLYRIGFSDCSKVMRFFWVSNDLEELRWGESREDARFLRVRLDEVIGMTFGPETTAFARLVSTYGDSLSWTCFSLIFVGRTLDLCSTKDDADKWFMALQQVIGSRGFMLLPRLARCQVLCRKVMMKIRYKAAYLKRSLPEHFRISLEDCARHRASVGRAIPLISVRDRIRGLRSAISGLREEAEVIEHDRMEMFQEGIWKVIREIVSARTKVKPDQQMKEELAREVAERKRLHNELMELKGNIRVFTRVRPFLPWETDRPGVNTVTTTVHSDAIQVWNEYDARKRVFEFDHIFTPHTNQGDVFKELSPFIHSFLDGYNVCLFAYGVTNSGKTYTMQGTVEAPGITIRALGLLFGDFCDTIETHLSCVQIYNETVYDLLNEMSVLELRGESFEAEGVTSVPVHSLQSALTIMQSAAQRRSTDSTRLNQSSSRSHFVVSIRRNGAKLNLVDLAGSENVNRSGATGKILQEAKYINRSLSALGDVIHGLIEHRGKNHVPFRNSKLTMLLRDSLQGNSKTAMIVQVSPSQADVVETLSSLQFASRVRTVELGKASRRSLREVTSPTRD